LGTALDVLLGSTAGAELRDVIMSLRNHRKKETEEYPEHRENFGQKSCTMSTFPHEVSGNTSVC